MKKIILGSLLIIFINCHNKDKNVMQENIHIDSNQSQNEDNIPFPGSNSFTKEYLTKNFWKCNYSNAGEKLKYFLILPNYVKPSSVDPVEIQGTGLTNIGRYKTIDKNPYIEVAVYYETTNSYSHPEEWLVSKLNMSKESIIKGAKITKDGMEVADGISSIKDGNEQIVSRHTVYKRGTTFFYLRSDCSLKDYTTLAEVMQHINLNIGFN